MNRRGIGTLAIIIVGAVVAGAVAAGGYLVFFDDDGGGDVELWVAPYTPEMCKKHGAYDWTSVLLENPDVILNSIEVSDNWGWEIDDEGLEDLPEGFGQPGKGVKYEVAPGDVLEIAVDQAMEDYSSAGVGKGGDIPEDKDWYGWEADDWQDLSLEIAEETHKYEYEVSADADEAVIAVRYYPTTWAWVWTTVWPKNLREQKQVEDLISIEVYDESKGGFVSVGFEWEGGWGAYVSPETDFRLVVEETNTTDYEFSYWWNNKENKEIKNNFILIESDEIEAGDKVDYFSAVYKEKLEKFTLEIADPGPHSVSPESGEHSYEEGKEVNISASADSGFGFVKWTGNEGAVEAIDDIYDNNTTILMDNNYSIEPVFDRLVTLDVSCTEGGTVLKPTTLEGPDSTEIVAGFDGDNVDLLAEPDEGHKFVGWFGDTQLIDDHTAAETEMTLEYDSVSDQSVKANFEPIVCTLSISSSENGRVEKPGEGEFEYEYGETVNLRAVPDTGQEFGAWTDIDTIKNRWAENTTIEVQYNYDILADFDPVTYMIEWIGGEGTVSGDKGKIVDCGPEDVPCVENYVGVEKVVFTADPADGWKVKKWWDNEGGQTRTLYTENGTKHIWVEFEKEE